MALTPTKQIPLGFIAPDFTLPDTVSGKTMSLEQLKSDKATVVMFICNHCPYVKHVNDALVALANDYMPKGVAFVAISSNDAEAYPADGPEQMKTEATRLGYPFPYLYDETQEVAKAYTAECTPDFNIFDGNLRCVYRGQLDGSRPGSNVPVTGKDMRQALDAILAGKPVSTDQTPSVGCNIKWKG
ncbi:thioredoxin family protein [Microscilla marina]|uniref:Thioredoxin family protein n=1 Tax=Microscilla marina ATCC 23134 TaxID=313606 RepID=A1ZJQ8_MICM2|nr:thioredoxin family protein [Microscilla marina]EAY29361.1 thioredoxin family protein [Microscilla marina ATCC 23134]